MVKGMVRGITPVGDRDPAENPAEADGRIWFGFEKFGL